MGHHFLLQEIFPTQGSNPHLLHWQADSLPRRHLASPWRDQHVAYDGCFPGGSLCKKSTCNAGDAVRTRALGRSLAEGNGSPLQNSYLR